MASWWEDGWLILSTHRAGRANTMSSRRSRSCARSVCILLESSLLAKCQGNQYWVLFWEIIVFRYQLSVECTLLLEGATDADVSLAECFSGL